MAICKKNKQILIKIGGILDQLDVELKNVDSTTQNAIKIQINKFFLEKRALMNVKQEVTKIE